MGEIYKKNILNTDEILQNIMDEFKKVDFNNKRSLNQ